MERDPTEIRDALATFREYMRLERRRSNGLSAADWDRWQALRKRLDGAFGALDVPGGCSGRRSTPRVPTSLVVRFENFAKMGSMMMGNISRGGIFVPTRRPAEIGTRLKLIIELDEPPREIRIEGEVVSRNVGPSFAVDERGMGIRFLSLNSSDQALIDELYEQQFETHLRSE